MKKVIVCSKFGTHPNKMNLKSPIEDYDLLNDYKDFCVEQIRTLLIGFKANIDKDNWKVDRMDPNAALNVTIINGIINCLRLLVENGKTGDVEYYKSKLSRIKGFHFKSFKSSQYRKMGQAIYDRCFK